MTATSAVAARLRSAGTLTVAVILVTLMIAGATFAAMTHGDDDTARLLMQRRASQVTVAVQSEVNRYLDALNTTGAAAGAHDTLTNAKFQQLSSPLAGMRLSGATAVAYLLPVDADRIGATEALWRSRGVTDLRLRPVGNGEHIFAVMVRPLDGLTTARTGVDATQSRPLWDTLRAARDTGRPAVSEPYALVVDQAVPLSRRQLSFTLAVPVYGLPAASGVRAFLGWVTMSLRSRDFLGNVLPTLSDGLLGVTLSTTSAEQGPPVVVHPRADARAPDMTDTGTVTVADRSWHLRIDASRRDLIGAGALPRVVTVAVLALGLVLAALVHVLATGRGAQRTVDQATADLAAAEARAREQASLLTTIVDAMSDGVGVVDDKGDFLLHNPAAKAMLGIAEDRNGARHWQEHYGIFLPDDSGPFPTGRLPLVRALAGEQVDLADMLIRNGTHPDGVMISVSARPLRLQDDRVAAVAVFHDVTARRADTAAIEAARDELAAQKDYLTQVLDALQITVITCDSAGMLVHTNATGGARVGQPSLTGRHINEVSAGITVTDPEGQVIDADDMPMLRVLRGADAVRQEAMVRFATGRTRAVVLNAQPLQDRTGARIGAVGSSYDITALREREADLAAFAGVAAHDLRAPLMVVAGWTDLLAEDLDDGAAHESMQPTVARIKVGIRRMQQLIDDLLAYATARDARVNLQKVDLRAVVDDIITERTTHLTVAGREPVPVPEFLVGPLPIVEADASMIRQVFDNLIGNALKYTRPGEPARVDIAAHHLTDDPPTICLTIADRGIGIPAEEQPHVFDQFHRVAAHTKEYTGTGLGLAICKRVLQRHDGTIAATDNPGGGTRMVITMPVTSGMPEVRSSRV